jgi:DNA-binding XRE family transcriptional regulator
MAQMKVTPLSEIVDEVWGPAGTPERDGMEARLKEELRARRIGEAIRSARVSQHMTQGQLGERIGVQRAQISRLEKGKSISLSSMSRVFKALGVATASLDLGAMGKVALW